MPANITVEFYRGAMVRNNVAVQVPEGLMASALVTTDGTNDYSAAIPVGCTIVALTSDVSSNVIWDGTATPSSGQATTAHPILPAGITRFFAIQGDGVMKLAFRNVA